MGNPIDLLPLVCSRFWFCSSSYSQASPLFASDIAFLVPDPHYFDSIWAIEKGDGYGGGGTYAFATALLQVVYSYKGWENANYVLGEPRTLGGRSLLQHLSQWWESPSCTCSPMLRTSPPSCKQIWPSPRSLLQDFFEMSFGESAAARSLPAFVALSNIGNVLAVSFAHSRVNQELAKRGYSAIQFVLGVYQAVQDTCSISESQLWSLCHTALTIVRSCCFTGLSPSSFCWRHPPTSIQLYRQPVSFKNSLSHRSVR